MLFFKLLLDKLYSKDIITNTLTLLAPLSKLLPLSLPLLALPLLVFPLLAFLLLFLFSPLVLF